MGMRLASSTVFAPMALAAMVQVGFGCRQIVGVEDREPPRSCGAQGDGSTCQACLAEACCDELELCSGDPTCDVDGKLSEAAVALRVCTATSCAQPCAVNCGGATAPVVGCQPCGAACCAQAEACAQSSDCGLLELCQQACAADDPGCREACVNAHSEGASLAISIDECVNASCDLGADWSCLGAVERAAPSEDDLSYRINLYDNATDEPVPDIEVKGCFGNDLDCDRPFATAITGPNGFVDFELPPTPSGVFLEYGGGDYYAHLLFFNPPITEDGGTGSVAVRTADFDAINQANGWTLERGRGTLLLTVLDCKGQPAPGVVLSASTADERTITLYYGDETRSGSATDATGTAILFNLPEGGTVITARVKALCKDSGAIDLLIKPDALSLSHLPPTP